jgi:hypothetical protein
MSMLGRAKRELESSYRKFVFGRAVSRLRAAPEESGVAGGPVLERLVYGWGNEGWAAREEYLSACIAQTLVTAGPILECGSGLTTAVLGAIATDRGIPYCALEHDAEWAARVRSTVGRLGLSSVDVIHAPLRTFGDFWWYDVPMNAIPRTFTMIVCDGPPGDTEGGRYGLVPVMESRIARDAVILLDDAERSREREIALAWSRRLGFGYQLVGGSAPYIRLSMESGLNAVDAGHSAPRAGHFSVGPDQV